MVLVEIGSVRICSTISFSPGSSLATAGGGTYNLQLAVYIVECIYTREAVRTIIAINLAEQPALPDRLGLYLCNKFRVIARDLLTSCTTATAT